MTELPLEFDFEDFAASDLGNTGTNCTVLDGASKTLIQIQPPKGMIKSDRKKTKSRQLAERIADIDFVIQKRTDLLQSVNEVKRLYEEEQQLRVEIEKKLAYYEQENIRLKDEVEEEKYKNNQLQAVVDETKVPFDVQDLVKGFVDLALHSSDLSRAHLKYFNKLKPYCEKNGISTIAPKSPKKKTNSQSKSIDAAAILARKPDTCTRGTQFDGLACTKVSCGTMTTSLIKYKDFGVMFPEPGAGPDALEILDIMESWNQRPISPLRDEICEEVNETQTRDTSSCTNICDINKVVDYADLMPHIKYSDSRPPSRLMCTDVKNEVPALIQLPTDLITFKERVEEALLCNGNVPQPKFSSDIFVKLWPVFGHMMLKIMNICSSTPPDEIDEILNVLLPKVSQTFSNFETDILPKPVNFAIEETVLPTKITNMSVVNPVAFEPIVKDMPKVCDESTATSRILKTSCPLQEVRSNKLKESIESTENMETAVSFLSSQEIFNIECEFGFRELDEREKDLLAAANEPATPTATSSLLEPYNEVEHLSPNLSIDENVSTENDATAQSANNGLKINSSVYLSSPESLIIDESVRTTSDEEETANEIQLASVDNENQSTTDTHETPLLALNEETAEVVYKTKSTVGVIDLQIAASTNVDSNSALLKPRKRRRNTSTDLTQSDYPVPCKRSARLVAKRLAEHGRIVSTIQIGKYTSRKVNFQKAYLDNKPFKTFYNNIESPNCDKLVEEKLFANENNNTSDCPTKASTSADVSLKDTQKYSETTDNALFCYDSPASPDPSNNLINDVSTPEIPLELRDDLHALNFKSFTDRLYKLNERNFVGKKAQVAKDKFRDIKLAEKMQHVVTEYLNTSIGEIQELYFKLCQISLNDEVCLLCLVTLVEQLQEINTQIMDRFMNVLRHFDNNYPNFINRFLTKLEGKLFVLDCKRKPKIDAALKMTHFYLATIRLQATLKSIYTNPARIFIAKILYFFQLEDEGARLIYEVLCQFPTSLPHREDRSYDNSDPLITVIKHLLMSCKYDMYDQKKCHRELLSILRFQYHYEPFKPLMQDVLKQLVDKLECGKQEHLQLSFAIICKRMPHEKIMNDVLHAHLLPLANTYYKHALQSPSYDERIEILLTCMSTILKALPLETDTSQFMSVFTRFLNGIERQRIQEAAVQAILRLQRFGFEACGRALLRFRPISTPNNLTMLMLRTYVQRKTKFSGVNKSKT